MNKASNDWRSEPAPAWAGVDLGDQSIPGYRYTSREFAEKEFDGVFAQNWLLLGRESELSLIHI